MRSRAAYSIMELMIVLALIGTGGGIVFSLVVEGAHRFQDAATMIERRTSVPKVRH